MAKSPLQQVKDKFESKAKLLDALKGFTGEDLWVARTSKAKGLEHVSNAKLLRLHETFSAVKKQFGTRDKLVDAILALENRAKDAGYKTKLSAYPVPRLFDMWKSADKRKKAADKAAAAKK